MVLDASLLADNLYFIKERETSCKNLSIREITHRMAALSDIVYFSARKLGCARGGGICLKTEEMYRNCLLYTSLPFPASGCRYARAPL